MLKTAVGSGRLYFCRLSYNPVPGERKSGIPAAVGKLNWTAVYIVKMKVNYIMFISSWHVEKYTHTNMYSTAGGSPVDIPAPVITNILAATVKHI